jgi:hypothetical protein
MTRRAPVHPREAAAAPGQGPPGGAPQLSSSPLPTILALAACAGPFVWLGALVLKLGVNVPFWDEWAFIPDLKKSAAGTLGPADFWRLHNEHRLFFPRLVFLPLAHFTHWNLRAEMILSVVLAAVIFVLVATLMKRTLYPFGRGVYLLAIVAAAWFVFSPIQYQNWLWGWQVQWFLSDLAALAAVAVLSSWPATRPALLGVVCGIAAAVVASYSLASGLLIWAACLVIFVRRKPLRPYLPVWFVAAGITIGAYLVGYKKPPQTPPLTAFLHHPGAFAAYLFRYIGGPLFGNNGFSALIGAALIAAFLVAAVFLTLRAPEAFERAIAWVALGTFAMLAAALTAIGRVGFGVDQSEASRYTTTSTLFLLSTLALVLVALTSRHAIRSAHRPATVAVPVLVVVLVAGLIGSYRAGLAGMDGNHSAMEQDRLCLQRVQGPEDPCLKSVVPGGGLPAWNQLQYLRQARLGGVR